MDTSTAYDTPRRRTSGAATGRVGMPPSVMDGIRAALVARGSSLRQWAHAWARAHGADAQATYLNLRMTIRRRLDRGLPPLGDAGARLVAALRADLGPVVVPVFDETTQPAGGRRAAGR